MAKDVERDWARANPQPRATAGEDRLTLWNFPVAGSALGAEHRQAIENFVAVDLGLSAALCRTEFHVVGHASNSGSERGNLSLSEQRAEAVATYLGGLGAKQVTVTWMGSDAPVDESGTGYGCALNRRVEIGRFRPEPASRVPPLEAGPAGGKGIGPKSGDAGEAGGIGGTIKVGFESPPLPVRLHALAIDVRLIGEIEVSVQGGQGDTALVGAVQGGRVTPEFETVLTEGLKGKVAVKGGEDGEPPGLQLGVQLERLDGKPELGVQAGLKPVYVEYQLKEMTPLEGILFRGVRCSVRFTGKVRFDFGPSETAAAKLLLTQGGAVAGVLATAAVINGGTALLAQAAREEGMKAMIVLAERDGVATAVAYEVLGTDALSLAKSQELQWMKLEGDTRAAFRAGKDQVNKLLTELGPDGRTERRKRWDAAYSQGQGAQGFPDVQRRVFEALGGCEWKVIAGKRLEDL